MADNSAKSGRWWKNMLFIVNWIVLCVWMNLLIRVTYVLWSLLRWSCLVLLLYVYESWSSLSVSRLVPFAKIQTLIDVQNGSNTVL